MSSRTLPLTDELRAYLLRVGVREPALLAELRAETAELPQSNMQICPEQGALMTMLTQLLGAARVLEVGTFTGYSSTAMAMALPDHGRITCCDLSDEWTSIARRYWERAGVAHKVELRLGPALETLDVLLAEGRAGVYDLAFVDADKENYAGYHERCLELLRPGGAVLYDNVLWGGSVLNEDDDRESTVAVRALNERLASDERVDVVMVPIGDGLTICRKR